MGRGFMLTLTPTGMLILRMVSFVQDRLNQQNFPVSLTRFLYDTKKHFLTVCQQLHCTTKTSHINNMKWNITYLGARGREKQSTSRFPSDWTRLANGSYTCDVH